MKPISPRKAKPKFSDKVIEVWNDLIQKNLRGNTSRVTQNEAAMHLAAVLDVPRQHVFDNGWLDIESVFRKAGWKVVYDKPGYNESYEAYFVFTAKK